MQTTATVTACRRHIHIVSHFILRRQHRSEKTYRGSGRGRTQNQGKEEAGKSGESDHESKLRTKTVHTD